MKINENKFDLQERINKYELDSARLMYDLASDLLNEVSDEDVLKLYKDNKIFSKISTMSNEEILNNKVMLKEAIDILIDYFLHKPLTQEEFENMTFDEIFDYVGKLLEDKNIDLFDIVKYIESR